MGPPKREFTFHWGDERRFPGGKHCLSWTTGGMADGRKDEPRAEACVSRAGTTHPGFRDPAGASVVGS